MTMEYDDVPYFVRVRGCINCDVSEMMKRQTGRDYGFDHELVLVCILRGCYDRGHAINKPFFDPEEVLRAAKKIGRPEAEEAARLYCNAVQERFGRFYNDLGIPLPAG